MNQNRSTSSAGQCRLDVVVASILLMALPACKALESEPPPPRGPRIDTEGYYFVAKINDAHYVRTEIGSLHTDRESAAAEMEAWVRSQVAPLVFAKVHHWKPSRPLTQPSGR